MRLLGLRRPIPLPSVLKPIGHLRQGQARLLREHPLLIGVRILVTVVTSLKGLSGLLLEAVDRLLAVPYGLGQGVLLPKPVLVDGAQGPVTGFFGFRVARVVPDLLKLVVAFYGELMG